MSREKWNPLGSIVVMIMSASAFFALVQDRRVWMIGDFLFRRGEPNLHRLEFIWQTDPRGVIMLCACVLLALIFVISLLRFLMGLFKALAGLGSSPAESVEQANTAARRQASPARAQTPAARRQAPARERRLQAAAGTYAGGGQRAAQPYSYTYKSGRERYMEQLDGFLRDGMVTREQYNELVRLYEKETAQNGRK